MRYLSEETGLFTLKVLNQGIDEATTKQELSWADLSRDLRDVGICLRNVEFIGRPKRLNVRCVARAIGITSGWWLSLQRKEIREATMAGQWGVDR